MTLAAEAIRVCQGERDVIRGLSLACRTGRITGVIGPNGAGKSTLLKALGGLLPLAAGEIRLDGLELGQLGRAALARRLAFLPQARTVHWPLAVAEVVALGRLPYGDGHAATGPGPEAIGRAMQAMEVAHLAERPASALSGGELARVLVARALAQEAPVIIADEPTAGLDPAHALRLFEVFEQLARDGRTLVVALHDLSLAARFCHDLVMLTDGRIAAAGLPGHVLRKEKLADVYGAEIAIGAVDGVPAIVPVRPIGDASAQ